jgi:hypothetical protein
MIWTDRHGSYYALGLRSLTRNPEPRDLRSAPIRPKTPPGEDRRPYLLGASIFSTQFARHSAAGNGAAKYSVTLGHSVVAELDHVYEIPNLTVRVGKSTLDHVAIPSSSDSQRCLGRGQHPFVLRTVHFLNRGVG